jgi:uncharacterized membrane protein YgaE (UPF0421/DUF939 family)
MQSQSLISQHIIHGLKTGLASILSYGITEYLNMPHGFWAVITTVIVMQVYVADSLNMSIYRFTGTAIGATIGIVAISIFPGTPVWTGLSLFITISLCSFMTRYNIRYKMAAITVVIVILASVSEPDRVTFGLFRVLEIVIGIFSASLVSVLIVPAKRVDLLKKSLTEQAVECAEKYNEITKAFLSKQKHVDDDLLESLTQKTWQNHEIYQMIMRHEAFIYKKDVYENLALLVTTLGRFVEHLRTMTRALNAIDSDGFKIIMEKEMKNLAVVTGEALIDLVNMGSGKRSELIDTMESAEDRIKALRSEGVTSRFNIEKLTQVFSFYHSMHCLAEDIIDSNDQQLKNIKN